MKLIDVAKTIRQETNNIARDYAAKKYSPSNEAEKKIIDNIYTKGFHIITDFYSPEKCIKIKDEIDRLLEKYRDKIFVDSQNADHRIYAANKLSPEIDAFFTDTFINQIIRLHEQSDNIVGFTMAGKLEYHPGNINGSGEGWHRDRTVAKQTKAILYLTDVHDDNGPFQYLEGSHRHMNIIQDCLSENFDFNQSRFSNKQIDALIHKKYKEKLLTLTGKAGTLILVNTRGIHRGMPIKNGSRYALTHYCWSNMPIPSHMANYMIKT